MDSYDVRFWDIKKLGNGTGARFRVRWAVDGREHCKSFKARPLADGFLDGLKDAVRDRRPFNPRTGLPEAETTGDEMVTWYAARPRLRRGQVGRTSPRSPAGRSPRPWSPSPSPSPPRSRARPRRRCCGRRCSPGRSTPPPATADPPPEDRRRPRLGRARLPAGRRAGGHRDGAARAGRLRQDPDREGGGRVDAAAQAVGVLQRPRLRRRTGPPRLQPGRPHPVDHPRRRARASTGGSWSAPPRPAACWPPSGRLGERGQHLEAFFACLYYAALRPSEAVMLREADLHLPKKGWGRIVLAASASRAGTAWTDRRHRAAGTRPEAPRRQRDPHHPHPARTGAAAARPHQAVRHHPRRAGLPDRPGRHPAGLRLQRGLGPRPAGRRSPPPSTGRRSAAAPTTCGTRRCRCG